MTASLTKVPLAAGEIEALARAAFGHAARVVSAVPAQGGMYNAGYHLELAGAGPAQAFLKAAPPGDIACLTHERGLMRAEADTLRRLAGAARAPRILHADMAGGVVPRDILFLEHLPGVLLSEADPPAEAAPALRREIGALAAGIQAVRGRAFGYPHDRSLQAPTWREAFGRMLGAVLDDAGRLGVAPSLEPLRARLDALLPLLDSPFEARLIHYDLWDGNILVARSRSGWGVTGLIDWERAFYGDPLAELVSLSFHTPGMAPDPAVLEGWSGVSALDLDDVARRRLALYRAYLWLIMLTEAGPRGFLQTQPAAKWPAIRRRLERDLAVAEGD